MSDIGFGLIGYGIGRTRARMIADQPGTRLVAVSDLSDQRRADAAGEFGVPTYADYRDMLARDDVDMVGIYTPAGVRREIALDAFDAGKHVLCTKPMEVSIARCDDMIDAADAAGRKLIVEFDNRYSPSVQSIKAALDQGVFGRVRTADIAMKWFRPQEYYDANGGWRGTYGMDGGGSLANQAIHFIDQMQWFMGPPKSVVAHTATVGHQIEAEDLGVALITWQSGAVTTFTGTTSTVPDFQYTRIDVHGERGGFIAVLPHTGYLHDPTRDPVDAYAQWRITDADGVTISKSPVEPADAPQHVFEEIVSVMTNGTEPLVDGREGRKSIEILNGIYLSARSGEEVMFPLTEPFVPND